MARKAPKQELVPLDLNHEALAEATKALDTATQIERRIDADNDEILAAGIDLGRLETAVFFTTVGESATLAIYENVKKSKAWALLRNPENSHGGKFESLEEFCRIKLGRSYNRLQSICANRNLIGQDVFTQAEKLGLRQVDYNALKALPAPAQELVRRAVEEATTREEVIDLLQELAAQQGALAKQSDELAAQVQDKERLIAAKNGKIDELDAQLSRKFKPKPHSLAKSAEEAAALTELTIAINCAEVDFARLAVVVSELQESEREPIRERARQAIDYLGARMREIVLEHQLVVTLDTEALGGRPAWLDGQD